MIRKAVAPFLLLCGACQQPHAESDAAAQAASAGSTVIQGNTSLGVALICACALLGLLAMVAGCAKLMQVFLSYADKQRRCLARALRWRPERK